MAVQCAYTNIYNRIIIFEGPWHQNILKPLVHKIFHALYYFWVTLVKLFMISAAIFSLLYSY